jgi:hypothetical protein
MKVALKVEFEVEPEKELTKKEEANIMGMLVRVAKHRLGALIGRRLGGEVQPVGWEITVKELEVSGQSKVK